LIVFSKLRNNRQTTKEKNQYLNFYFKVILQIIFCCRPHTKLCTQI